MSRSGARIPLEIELQLRDPDDFRISEVGSKRSQAGITLVRTPDPSEQLYDEIRVVGSGRWKSKVVGRVHAGISFRTLWTSLKRPWRIARDGFDPMGIPETANHCLCESLSVDNVPSFTPNRGNPHDCASVGIAKHAITFEHVSNPFRCISRDTMDSVKVAEFSGRYGHQRLNGDLLARLLEVCPAVTTLRTDNWTRRSAPMNSREPPPQPYLNKVATLWVREDPPINSFSPRTDLPLWTAAKWATAFSNLKDLGLE
ncbi:hypothetical protein M427DRAFT_45240 [Gonapodya prolifera JEL478]|uniref:Uncharacterized protein n=1 Tax=Gonapodya prolifera (strain JEL478) TaxID=1344416 RepID=A0A139ABS5_GONPJ|nr:hypothetical protein M427DRAFT_45240 [Gonapodya prolifera JEL478]|eukprot:KXS14178.1 hypothetical protein M427DRAFT_45240 [Gonapodya prolifera JEL478]